MLTHVEKYIITLIFNSLNLKSYSTIIKNIKKVY